MYNKRVDNLVNEILERCKEQDIDVKLIYEKLNFAWLPETPPEVKKQLQDAYENDEFNMAAFEALTPMPTEEELMEECMDFLADMQKGREAISYICYEENCPNRIKDLSLAGFVDEDEIYVMTNLDDNIEIKDNNLSNNNLNINSEVQVMTDLDDIASLILSDIYGGIY